MKAPLVEDVESDSMLTDNGGVSMITYKNGEPKLNDSNNEIEPEDLVACPLNKYSFAAVDPENNESVQSNACNRQL